MKTVVFASITGAVLALAIGGAACQSSSSGSDPASDPTGVGGTSSNGGTSAGTSSAGTTAATGGSTAGGSAGTPGAGGSAGTPGAGGTTTAGGSAGAPSTGGTSSGGSSTTGGSAGTTCGKVTTLHPPNPDAGTATIFCPFSGVDGGSNDYCNVGTEHCCEGKTAAEQSACTPLGTACPGADYTDWQCEDPADCGSGKACCGNGSLVVNADPACGNYASKMSGTTCKAACDPTDITMCTSDDECGAGHTCIPFGKAGNQVGGCSKLVASPLDPEADGPRGSSAFVVFPPVAPRFFYHFSREISHMRNVVGFLGVSTLIVLLGSTDVGCSSDSSTSTDPGGDVGGSSGDTGGTGGAAAGTSSTGGTGTAGKGGTGTAGTGTAGTGTAGKGGTGTAGTGTAGTGTAGSGTAGTGTAGKGTAGTGTAGTGTAGTGTAGSGTAGTGTAGDGGAGGGTAGSGTGGTTCNKPTTLHPPNADAGTATIFCPFSAVDGGKNDYCNAGSEHCCEGKTAAEPSTCTPLGTACPAPDYTDWNCEDPADCGQGMQCCGNGTVVINADPACANYASKMNTTTCKAACDPLDITMCTSDDECGAGHTCIPFGKAGNQVGGCSK